MVCMLVFSCIIPASKRVLCALPLSVSTILPSVGRIGLVVRRFRLVKLGWAFIDSQRTLQLSSLIARDSKSKSTRPLLMARALNKIAVSASFVCPKTGPSLVTRLLPVKALGKFECQYHNNSARLGLCRYGGIPQRHLLHHLPGYTGIYQASRQVVTCSQVHDTALRPGPCNSM
jgi:hypothetical protein